jgi:hypothetical protein
VDGTLDEQLAYCSTHVIRLLARDGIFAVTPEGLRQHEAKDIVAADSGIWFGSGWFEVELYTVEHFRWIRDEADLLLRVPAGGSVLQFEFEAGPGVGPPPYLLQVLDGGGATVAEWTVTGRATVRLCVPPASDEKLQLLRFRTPGGGWPVPHDPRIMNFRFFGIEWVQAEPSERAPWTATTVSTTPPDMDWMELLKGKRKEIAEMGLQPFLHLYGCGDFQLMAQENWADLRGYAELDQFSMHLDSLLSYAAHHLGIQEECLPAPMRIFHLEHDVGSGWTPEGYKQLSEQIARKGIQSIAFSDLALMVAQMRRFHAPLIFNLDNWGLNDYELVEIFPARRTNAART